MVAFSSTINPWRDRLTKLHDSQMKDQLERWIDELFANGSTNTLSALRFALADPKTEAIYLLTDGRPDQVWFEWFHGEKSDSMNRFHFQNERHILSQVQYRQVVPIHTIAFNCQDHAANQFLFDLSKQSGGRFHAFNYGFEENIRVDLPEVKSFS